MKQFNTLSLLFSILAIGTLSFAQPTNDNCANAIDLNSSLGQGAGNIINAGTYDNTGASTGNDDPDTGYDCFGEPDGLGAMPSLENTVWFKITGDGNTYAFEATTTGCNVSTGITNNDTQIAVYTNGCGTLTPVICNEDGPNVSSGNYPALVQFTTGVNTEYLIMVDGLSFNGQNSVGEFCLFIEQQASSACNSSDVSGGTATAATAYVCEGDNLTITLAGASAPNEGILNGYAWVISTTDLEGNPDLVVNQNYPAGLNVTPTPTPLSITLSGYPNIFSLGTTYYFTMVAFGNATWANPDEQVFISQAVLDAGCTTLSNSLQIDYCTVGIPQVDEAVLNMEVFPNPTQDFINLNINAVDYGKATVMVTNTNGQIVHQQHINLTNSTNTFSMNVSQLTSGVYIASVEIDGYQSVSRFLKY